MALRHVLAPLGVDHDAEEVYRALLAHPGSSASDLRGHTGIRPERLRRALVELGRRAMVTEQPGVPTRYQPSPPDAVVDVLIAACEKELKQVRLETRRWKTQRITSTDQLRVNELVEIVPSREAYDQRWQQIQQATKKTLEVFVRRPFVQPLAEPQLDGHEGLQASLLARGVESRGIYDDDALRTPEILDHVRRMTRFGETARVVSHLPLKLVLSDRSTALIPVVQSDPESTYESALVVHQSTLLDALVTLFDIYWERGTEVAFDEREMNGHGALDEDTIITLLAAGVKDEAIARQLGVSPHTVRRRIAALCKRLGVTTRFQAGLALGQQRAAEH
jgi:regulatory LuxR family protein/transcriptional regulator TrmB